MSCVRIAHLSRVLTAQATEQHCNNAKVATKTTIQQQKQEQQQKQQQKQASNKARDDNMNKLGTTSPIKQYSTPD